MKLLEEEAEQHRRQQEKLEVELQNARQQLLVVPSSREAKSSLEDRMVDSPDPTRFAGSEFCYQASMFTAVRATT